MCTFLSVQQRDEVFARLVVFFSGRREWKNVQLWVKLHKDQPSHPTCGLQVLDDNNNSGGEIKSQTGGSVLSPYVLQPSLHPEQALYLVC